MAESTTEVLAEDLKELTRSIGGLRSDLAEFRGTVRSDLTWIKGIGAALVAMALSFAGWVIWDISWLTTEVHSQAAHSEKVEKRLDDIESRLDVLIRRTEPKAGG
jgi:hypothetical protein